ncbi:MAG: hypothetical protein OEN56_06725 [Gemmatimonadota bacterium]|nr:hypothetical protein [Gemmatimonadota bacterium]
MRRGWIRRATLGVLSVAGLVTAWSAERGSLERANRLQRGGRVAEAAELYEARTLSAPSDAEVRYNLGTALIGLDSSAADIELGRATQSGPREIRGLAQYNLGLVRLRRALGATDPDSVRENAAAAIGANRSALRLRPEDQNAKWNLAMALRLLDSIDAFERRSGRELTEGAVEADVVTRSVNVPDAAEDEFAEDPPAEGERETVAVAGDEAPLSPEEAAEILGTSHRDPTEMLGKLLQLEGRARAFRVRRPTGVRRW